jgi:hypothetical protein
LKQACKQQEGDILQKILSTEESCKTDQATLNPKTHAKLLHPDRYCSNWGSGSFARKCVCVCEVTRKKRKRQGLLAHLLPIANAMMVEWLRVKKYFPPASTFHGCLSEICTKPASLNLCLASSTAWKGVGAAFRNSKSSEAIPDAAAIFFLHYLLPQMTNTPNTLSQQQQHTTKHEHITYPTQEMSPKP